MKMANGVLLYLSVCTLPLCALGASPHVPASAAVAALAHAQALEKDKNADDVLASFYQAVEADPDFLAAHDWLQQYLQDRTVEAYQQEKRDNGRAIKELRELHKTIDAKYQEWQKRFPESLGIQYAIAMRMSAKEDPNVRPYLLKLVERDPTNAKVYSMLGVDALISGDKNGAEEYMYKATTLDPSNPRYALAYAMHVEPAKRHEALRDVAKRFPNTDTGASALYFLANDDFNDAQRIADLEQLRAEFPPEKFGWSADGMVHLFEAYVRVDPAKAIKLAQDMQTIKASTEWAGRVGLAQAFVEADKKLAAGKANESLALLDSLKPERHSENIAMIERFKARVMVQTGHTREGYQALLAFQAKNPDDETRSALQSMGERLHKTAAQVQGDIKAAVDAGAKPAPRFNLQQYTSDDSISLAKLRGKVVLLTFWFPGCGPCAEEFPHFEAVMRQFKHNKDVDYIGINIMRDQDTYVIPRVEKMGYSFTPLKGTDKVRKDFTVKGAPTNFVIDRRGRIVYQNFKIDDAHGELMLQRMIESVL